jgi:predicted acetyltransferase
MGTPGNRDSRQIEIRVVEESGLAEWGQALSTGFLGPVGDGHLEFRKAVHDPGRALGAYDRGRCVGTFRSTEREITVPGGAALVTDAITNVTVTATHRRRGLLTRMMTQDLAAAAERGDSLAILIAAEYRIYGRYGFGPATGLKGYAVNKLRAGQVRVPDGARDGSIELLTMEEWRKTGPDVHDRFRRTQPGALDRRPLNWRLHTGDLRQPHQEWKEPVVALYRDPDGRPAGFLSYNVAEEWHNMVTTCELTVHDHIAVDHGAAAALWSYALGIDWVDRLRISNIAPDDPLPLLLDDPRACVDGGDSSADLLWLRVLDAPTAFSARSYAAPGRVVLRVHDSLGYVDGLFAIDAAEDGTGRCTAVTGTGPEPDIALDASALGTLYLSSDSPARLRAAGLLTELRPGAVDRLGAMLRTDFRPWCPDWF